MLNSFCSTDWLKTSDIVSSRSTLHYITLHYITLHYITLLTFLHFGAFVRFFPHIQIFSRLYNLPPRQAFWSSRRPDSLAINGLNRSKKYKKGYSKFSIAFCGLLQRMMDFCKVRRIVISALTLLFVAPLGNRLFKRKISTNGNINSAIKHHAEIGHDIHPSYAEILETGVSSKNKRLFLESLHSFLDKNTINERTPFPRVYASLVAPQGSNEQ